MPNIFTRDYTGAPFVLFGGAHLAALAIIALINLLIYFNRKRFTERGKRNARIGMAVVLVLNEIAWHVWNYSVGLWTAQTMLPLHLCSLLVWGGAYMLVTRSYPLFEFMYFLGIAGASQALLTPDAGIYGFPHFRFWQTMISHGTIFTAAIYMTFVEGYRPYWRSVARVFIIMNIYMAFVGLVNWALGSNYMFIARKPETASLIDVLGPWPFYILSLEAIGLVLSLLLYLPFALKDRKRRVAGERG
ncbi:MAG: TIGR02206 family membrane protein [Chloroflexi bacterium]|nr:TIGR02206 family membrane protein [Chloroflexota bacterium]